MGFLQLILRLFFVLDGGIQQLFSILLTHLGLLLLLLFLVVLLILLIFLLILLLLIFLVVLLLIVITTLLVLLILLLFLLLMLAEHEVITRLIVSGVQTEGILVGLDGLSIHLMRLADHTHIMEGLCLTQGVRLQFRGILKLHHSRRVFLLCHQGIAQVEHGLRILGILLDGLTIGHLCIGIVATVEEFVTLTDILTIGLSVRGKRKEK